MRIQVKCRGEPQKVVNSLPDLPRGDREFVPAKCPTCGLPLKAIIPLETIRKGMKFQCRGEPPHLVVRYFSDEVDEPDEDLNRKPEPHSTDQSSADAIIEDNLQPVA